MRAAARRAASPTGPRADRPVAERADDGEDLGVADVRDHARLADLVAPHDFDHVELEHRRRRAYDRYCAVAHMHGRPGDCSMTSIAAPSPQPPNSAPVPEMRLGTIGMRHLFGLAVGSSPKNVRASIGAGGYPDPAAPLSRTGVTGRREFGFTPPASWGAVTEPRWCRGAMSQPCQ